MITEKGGVCDNSGMVRGETIQLRAAVPAERAGARLDVVAAALYPDFSRARLQKWIRGGQLLLDGHPAKPTAKVWGGEILLLEAEVEPVGEVLAEEIPLNVIHADDDILDVGNAFQEAEAAHHVLHPGGLDRLRPDVEVGALDRADHVHTGDHASEGGEAPSIRVPRPAFVQ